MITIFRDGESVYRRLFCFVAQGVLCHLLPPRLSLCLYLTSLPTTCPPSADISSFWFIAQITIAPAYHTRTFPVLPRIPNTTTTTLSSSSQNIAHSSDLFFYFNLDFASFRMEIARSVHSFGFPLVLSCSPLAFRYFYLNLHHHRASRFMCCFYNICR